MLALVIVIDYILVCALPKDKPPPPPCVWRAIDKAEDGTVSVRQRKHVTSKSVQNPNDPDAEYRSKAGKKMKGFSTNITETCDQKDKPNPIMIVDVKGATMAGYTYLESGVKDTKDVTGNKVSDGVCQSEDYRKLAGEDDFDFVVNGIHDKPSRFDLEQTDGPILLVTDRRTGEVLTAIPVKDDK